MAGLKVHRLPDSPVTRVSRWCFNCYLIDGDDGNLVVVDAFMPKIVTDLAPLFERRHPTIVTATHGHPDHIGGLTYTGGTTGKPKGVIGTAQSITTMTTVQLAEWEWPEHPKFLMCTPLSHAGAAFFTPTGQATQTCTGPCVCNLGAGTCVMPPDVW